MMKEAGSRGEVREDDGGAINIISRARRTKLDENPLAPSSLKDTHERHEQKY
jgi:hypothetical protein